jgi:hypothetical protein
MTCALNIHRHCIWETTTIPPTPLVNGAWPQGVPRPRGRFWIFWQADRHPIRLPRVSAPIFATSWSSYMVRRAASPWTCLKFAPNKKDKRQVTVCPLWSSHKLPPPLPLGTWYRLPPHTTLHSFATKNLFNDSLKAHWCLDLHRVDRVPGFLSSRTNWLPLPPHPPVSVAPALDSKRGHTRLRERGRWSQFERRDKHSGTLGVQ